MTGRTSRRKGKTFEQHIRRWFGDRPGMRLVAKAHAGEAEPDAVVEFRAFSDEGWVTEDDRATGMHWYPRLVIEAKNHKTPDLAGWWRQCVEQCDAYVQAPSGMRVPGHFPVLIHKRRGAADPAEQWVTMPLGEFVELLEAIAD